MDQRAFTRRSLLGIRMFLTMLISATLLTVGCVSHRPQPRAKYGDTMGPVGPSRDLYRNQPKFKP